jgi:hypothetical protein
MPFPAIDALTDVLYAGRQACIHVLFDDQPTTGFLGPEGREWFPTIVLARVTTDTWQRRAPMAGPAPKSSAHPGRAHVVQDGTAHTTQVLDLTDTEATARAADVS